MRRPLDVSLLDGKLAGRRVASVRRRGKFLLVDFDPPGTLLMHLGMSGRLLFREPTAPRLPHTHLVLEVEAGAQLHLVDPRRFGFAHWLQPGEESDDPSLAALGMEPLGEHSRRDLPPMLRRSNAPIKSLLLDQRLVAGVGNIYAAEALWRAGIRPDRPGRRTAVTRLDRLVGRLQDVLIEAVEHGGTTIRDYATPEGDFGSFAVSLQVYGRTGQPCLRCGTTLRDLRISGRSTPFCPSCQR
jgi:formamidopyrimidine-DNA glycosylase